VSASGAVDVPSRLLRQQPLTHLQPRDESFQNLPRLLQVHQHVPHVHQVERILLQLNPNDVVLAHIQIRKGEYL
jgi:hypothetical protein